MLPLLSGLIAAAIGTALILQNHLSVDFDGQRDVADVVRGLGLQVSLDDIRSKLNQTLDGVAANSAQLATNIELNLSSVAADLHDALMYFKAFMIVLSTYVLFKLFRDLHAWIEDRRYGHQTPMLVMMNDDGEFMGTKNLRLLELDEGVEDGPDDEADSNGYEAD